MFAASGDGFDENARHHGMHHGLSGSTRLKITNGGSMCQRLKCNSLQYFASSLEVQARSTRWLQRKIIHLQHHETATTPHERTSKNLQQDPQPKHLYLYIKRGEGVRALILCLVFVGKERVWLGRIAIFSWRMGNLDGHIAY